MRFFVNVATTHVGLDAEIVSIAAIAEEASFYAEVTDVAKRKLAKSEYVPVLSARPSSKDEAHVELAAEIKSVLHRFWTWVVQVQKDSDAPLEIWTDGDPFAWAALLALTVANDLSIPVGNPLDVRTLAVAQGMPVDVDLEALANIPYFYRITSKQNMTMWKAHVLQRVYTQLTQESPATE